MKRSWRIAKALLRISLGLILEYRVTVFIWTLAGVTPLVMMFVWLQIAKGNEVGGRSPAEFALYFLIAFLAVQCTQAWVVWNFDYRIRSGEFSLQLLRPFDPWFSELAENWVSNGLRLPVNLAIVALGLWLTGASSLIEAGRIPFFILALILAQQITFNISYAMGLVGLWTERIKSVDTWNYIMIFALGGGVFPLDLLSPGLRLLVELTPYPWIVGFPAAVMTGHASLAKGFAMQLLWIGIMVAAHRLLWARGLKRFGAVGG
jgi:ABC-2 type transport system permease protein